MSVGAGGVNGDNMSVLEVFICDIFAFFFIVDRMSLSKHIGVTRITKINENIYVMTYTGRLRVPWPLCVLVCVCVRVILADRINAY